MKRGPRPAGQKPYTVHGFIAVSADEKDFLRRRVEPLLRHPEDALIDLLANAYLIGLKDATEAHRP